jgi:hypothetical protein
LHVDPIQAALIRKGKRNGNHYSAGEFGIVSTLLVLWQQGDEVVDWLMRVREVSAGLSPG